MAIAQPRNRPRINAQRMVPPTGYHVIRMPNPTPPTPVTASDDIRILRAWMDAEIAHPGDSRAVLSAVESAIEECRARHLGRPSLSDLYDLVPAWLRPFFGLPSGDGLKRLLGRWVSDEQGMGRFQPGEAPAQWRLTEQERAVHDWELRGWKDWEIQRELTVKALRGDRAYWVPLDQVEALLASAHRKVLAMFGVPGQ